MNRITRALLCCGLVCLAVGAAACDDDGNPPITLDATDTEPSDGDADDDTAVDTDEDTEDDTDDDTEIADADTGEDVELDTTDTADADATDVADADMTDVDMEIDITWPSTPEDYVDSATTVAYLHELNIPALSDGQPTCCLDFGDISRDFLRDGTDGLDNALANVADGFAEVFSSQEQLDLLIESGEFAFLLDHREFDGMQTSRFVASGLFGQFDASTDYSTASTGNGEFLLLPATFEGLTGTPVAFANPSRLDDGVLELRPDTFPLPLPLGTTTLSVPLHDTVMRAEATLDGADVRYDNGTMSGYITLEDLAAAFNEHLELPACACLTTLRADKGLPAQTYTWDATNGLQSTCPTNLEIYEACEDPTAPEFEGCHALGGGNINDTNVCNLMPALLNAVADLDLDGDCAADPMTCNYEALSVGMQWAAVPATITGVIDPDAP